MAFRQLVDGFWSGSHDQPNLDQTQPRCGSMPGHTLTNQIAYRPCYLSVKLHIPRICFFFFSFCALWSLSLNFLARCCSLKWMCRHVLMVDLPVSAEPGVALVSKALSWCFGAKEGAKANQTMPSNLLPYAAPRAQTSCHGAPAMSQPRLHC